MSPNSDESGKQSLYAVCSGLPKFNQFFIGPLPTFPENFMQIH